MKVKEHRKQSADNPGQNLLRQIAKMPSECPISPPPPPLVQSCLG